MKSVAEVIGVSRSNLVERMRERAKKRIGRPPLPDDKLVAEIKAVIAELPTYGYRRVHAILKRQALAADLKPPNHKRVYRVMKVHGLLLDRHAGGVERRHDGRIAVDERNRRWCSDGFEIGCDNGERVRVAFALDCCDREAMSFLATTSGVSGENVRDLMLAAVEHRFGPVNRLPVTIEWLSDVNTGQFEVYDIVNNQTPATSANMILRGSNSSPAIPASAISTPTAQDRPVDGRCPGPRGCGTAAPLGDGCAQRPTKKHN